MTAKFYDIWDAQQQPAPTLTAVPNPAAAEGNPAYVDAAVARELDAVRNAPEGTRNAALNTAAFNLGQFVGAGHLPYSDTADALFSAGIASGLEQQEVLATVRSGLRAGETQPRVVPTPTIGTGNTLTALLPLSAPRPGRPAAPSPPDGDEAEHTTWWPRDLAAILEGGHEEPEAAFLARDDGHRLFYAGKVNGLLGESESGKTWVALLTVLQAIQVGQPALYLDFEDSASGVLNRLRAMGATAAQLQHLVYVSPEESLHAAAQNDLASTLGSHAPALIVADGVNAAMTLLGLDLESNKDSTAFAQLLLRPLARTGAAVVTVDHVPKNKEQRGKGGIGAQAKRAMVTGAAIGVEVTQEFGRGMTGRMRLSVDKDRPGRVRAVSAGARNAGTAVLTSHADGTVTVVINAPDLRPADERGPFRPTHLMEAVSNFLESIEGGASGAAIEKGVGGKAEFIRIAIEILVQEQHIVRTAGARGAVIHTVLEPFREVTSSTSSRPRPDLVPESGETAPATSSRPPSHYVEGTRSRGRADETTSSQLVPQDEVNNDQDDEWWKK